MRTRKPESPAKTYLEKGQSLSQREAQLLEQRIGGRFARRGADKAKSPTEIVALQLAFEDAQLNEWRERLAKVRARDNERGSARPS